MRIAYLDCFSGISGDMCLAALIDAGAPCNEIQSVIDSFQLGVRIEVRPVKKHAFRGLGLKIDHSEQHVHRNLRDIHALIQRARMASTARELALRIFERIARAEALVHGTTIDQVHFHEVGAIDSIVDIVGVAVAWDALGIERGIASPIPTGTGSIRIAHGVVQVPAPATAELLRGVPLAPCALPMEMTTPTGAALVRELVSDFGPMPGMQVGRIGYGAGTRDLDDRPNLLRVLIGESMRTPSRARDDSVVVLETNLDDVTGEQIGFACEQLWRAGALEVFTTPIAMKKGRPGTLLTVLTKPDAQSKMIELMLLHTGSLGVRYRRQSRTVLPRARVDVNSPWGSVPGKVSQLPNGDVDFSPEYDACREIALREGLRLADVVEEVRECYFAHDADEGFGEDASAELPLQDEDSMGDASAALRDATVSDRDEPIEESDSGSEASESPPHSDEPFYRWDSAPWQSP